MAEVWVVNASPVIVLAKVDRLDLLTGLAQEVLLPAAVVDEILAGPPTDPARRVLDSGWGRRVVAHQPPPAILEWSLGAGETGALALAVERHARVVLDDAEARRCARTLGVPLIGTLGIVLRAERRGLIPSALAMVQDLRAAGWRIDEDVVRAALARIAGGG